jgi:hypothetical protein
MPKILSFNPWNFSLKFWESTGLHLPKWELSWECESSFPHTPSLFLTLPGVCDVTLGLPLGPQPCNPFALVASPRLGLRHNWWCKISQFFQYSWGFCFCNFHFQVYNHIVNDFNLHHVIGQFVWSRKIANHKTLAKLKCILFMVVHCASTW